MHEEIALEQRAAQPILSIREPTVPGELGATFGRLVAELDDVAERRGLTITGAPRVAYHPTAGGSESEVAFPIASTPKLDDPRVRVRELPAGIYATIWHRGAYAGLGATIGRLRSELSRAGLATEGPFWEVAWSDPARTPDPADYLTEILWKVVETPGLEPTPYPLPPVDAGLPEGVAAYGERVAPFEIDAARYPGLSEHHVDPREGVTVRDVTLEMIEGERWPAFLVEPGGAGPWPAILWAHPAPGSRDTYLDEAVALARGGALSLLVTFPWSHDAFWGELFEDALRDIATHRRIVREMRRLVAWLAARNDVDGDRLAYVGHSYGASFGGVLAGIEPRVRSYALLAPAPTFSDIFVLNRRWIRGEARDEFARALSPLDPPRYLAHAAHAALFFQLGREDHFFPHERIDQLVGAASEPKRVAWYDADHYLDHDLARADRAGWLHERLGLAR